MKRVRKKLLVALLSLAVIACFGYGSVLAADDSGNTYKIDYNQQTDIHSVKLEDGSEVIIFCMNNQRHWPHYTAATGPVPLYEKTSIEEFCNENGITDPDKVKEFSERLKVILYAGYPYNGNSLYEITENTGTMTEAGFNKLLDAPASIRNDFPDSIGNKVFTIENSKSKDSDNYKSLSDFTTAVFQLGSTGKTKSGLTRSDIYSTDFYRAVSFMQYDDPVQAYNATYGSYPFLTETQAYKGTSNAVWNLMYNYGIADNHEVDHLALTNALNQVSTSNVLDSKPSSSDISIEGDAVFKQNTTDGKWYTGTITLKAPSDYFTNFKLTLPQGITTTTGVNEVKAGDSFVLVSDSEPQGLLNVSLTSTIPWMDGNLMVFEAVNGQKASDGKAFQNMVGAIIKKETVSASKLLTVAEKTTSVKVTKTWKDDDNKDGKRPSADEFAKSLHLMNGDTEVKGVTPVVTDNLDNTYTVTYEDLPLNDKNGNEIKYTVKEDEVTGYDADKSTVENGGTITNTQEKEEPKDPAGPTDPKDPSDNTDKITTDNGNDNNKTTVVKKVKSIVQTGDNGTVILYGSALVCAAVLVVLLVQIRKRKNSHVR